MPATAARQATAAKIAGLRFVRDFLPRWLPSEYGARRAQKGSNTPGVSRPKSTRLWASTATSRPPAMLDAIPARFLPEPAADENQETEQDQGTRDPVSMRMLTGWFSTNSNQTGQRRV